MAGLQRMSHRDGVRAERSVQVVAAVLEDRHGGGLEEDAEMWLGS